ncbi:hypothetical protein [Aquibacillus salsiterrae]|uniref:Uncharacterized protein n=1 Tax=Aquibacillus salsiterrae TaxID=2950439 RepID=A0A9X3WE72_9BACI|nr:hypothetical protein [Aquibacillus salsiterrae]MDC3417388.1 hypothetical protein [Aquibacillus salsiterrae]
MTDSRSFSPKFYIETLRIGSVEGASAINFGNNTPTNFENHSKHTQGFGTVSGDQSKISGSKSVLIEEALKDLFEEEDSELAEWLKEMILEKQGDVEIESESDEEEDEDEEDKEDELTDATVEKSIDWEESIPFGESDADEEFKIHVDKEDEDEEEE